MIARLLRRLVLAAASAQAMAAGATVAYLDNFGHVMVRTGLGAYPVTTKRGYDLSLSADGRLLLYARDEEGAVRSLLLCDTHTRRSRVLLTGAVRSGHFSRDGKQVAFLKHAEGKWQLWITPLDDPQKAAPVYREALEGFGGWSPDGTALVAFDANAILWLTSDGRVQRSVARSEICGNLLRKRPGDRVRIHPAQPEVLLLTAYYAEAPRDAPVDESSGLSGIFTYDLRQRKLTPVTGPEIYATDGEWSAAGDRILFTKREPSGRTAIYQTPWRGAGFSRLAAGSEMVESAALESFAGFYVFTSRRSTVQLCAGPELEVRATAEVEQRLQAAHAQYASSAGGGIFVSGEGTRTPDGMLAIARLTEARGRRPADCR